MRWEISFVFPLYRPETGRISHYFRSRMPEQFDAVIHIDRTKALIPFERISALEAGEVPETYPFAV
jgi:erythromycin esterase-like protein